MKLFTQLFISFSFLFLFNLNAFGQKEDRIWYFGGTCYTLTSTGAGIDFNSGSPVALTNSVMQFTEGSATQSNRDGSLLFYTNGDNIYDRTHSTMMNGLNIGGNISSEQPALIIPFVNDSTKFYVFAQDGVLTATGTGLHYSVVDITLNGGLGAVNATKAVLLQPATSESLTATKHPNGMDYWVITSDYDSTIFYSYKITSSGISSPIKTNILLNQPFWSKINFNNKGDKITYRTFDSSGSYLIRQIADFDLMTGMISNEISIDTGFSINAQEFSPNDSILYTESLLPGNTFGLVQYSVYATNILASRQIIFSLPISEHPYFSDLKLAPNGKIYVNQYCGDSINVINFPNIPGIGCGYQKNILYLAGKKSYLYFPNEIFQIYQPPVSVSENLSPNDLLNVFPNPSNGIFSIKTNGNYTKYIIFNAIGQKIYEANFIKTKEIEIVPVEFHKGVFFVFAFDNKGNSLYKKLIVN